MLGHSVRIAGEERTFRCPEGETLLSSALRSGLGFPYECNSGGCGTCQFELVEGEVVDLWPDAPGLSPRAKQRGRRLACQSAVAGDCTIKASIRSDLVPAISPVRRDMTFVEARSLTADMSEFIFKFDEPAAFLPGQFAMLRFPGIEGARAYSMSNLANAEGLWSFIIKRVPGGKGTQVLFEALQPGARIEIDGPYGHSYLRTGNGRDIVCVAGGSGLSPVMSILRGAVRAPELQDHRLLLFYGGRGPRDLCVEALLAADPELSERVELVTAISDDAAPDSESWVGDRGFIHDVVKARLGTAIPEFDYYFCGPPPMTDAVHRMLLLDFKVSQNQLYFDRFY